MIKTLSAPGKPLLIKVCAHNILDYWICSFRLPVSVINELEMVFANFFWKTKCMDGNGRAFVGLKMKEGLGSEG